MNKKIYLVSLITLYVFSLFLIYVELRQFPSLVFFKGLNAYIFSKFIILEYPYLLLILLHPILLFTVCFIEDRKGINYMGMQKRYSWVFMSLFVLLLTCGFMFFGFSTSTSLTEFSTWFIEDFTFGEIYSPHLYFVVLFSFAWILSSLYIDLFFLAKKVTETWWLKIPLVVVFWVFFTLIIPIVVGLFIPDFKMEVMFIVPNMMRPFWYYYLYFGVLKIPVILILLYDRNEAKR